MELYQTVLGGKLEAEALPDDTIRVVAVPREA
jgi:hypothetical protein